MRLIRTSPVASERVKALAERVIEGAPALSADETRELAEAIIEHNGMSEAQAVAKSDAWPPHDFDRLRQLSAE